MLRTWRSDCLLLYFLPIFLTKPNEACDTTVLCVCVCVNNHVYSEQAYELNVPRCIATCVLFCYLAAPLCEQQSPFTHTVFTDNGLEIAYESRCYIQDALCLTYDSLKLVICCIRRLFTVCKVGGQCRKLPRVGVAPRITSYH